MMAERSPLLKFSLPPKQFILNQLGHIPPVNIPIYVCSNNHYVDDISTTNNNAKKCSICKTKFIRCEFLEKLIRKSTFGCPFEPCDEIKDGATFNLHIQRHCHYRPINCPYCSEAIQFNKYFEHLHGQHDLPGDDDDDSPKLLIPIHMNLQRYGMYYKKWRGQLFFIRTYSGPTEGAYFWMEFFGPKGKESRYSATVQLTSETAHRTTIRFPISPIRSELESLSKTKAYAHISRNSLLNYIDGYKVNAAIYLQTSFVEELLDESSAC